MAAGVILTVASGLMASIYLSRKGARLILTQAAVFGTGKVAADTEG